MEPFYGNNVKCWIGIVEEVIDETYVRVRILGIHPIDKSRVGFTDLPMAVVLYPTTGGQTGYGHSQHNLEVDSWVTGYSIGETYETSFVTGVIQGTDYSMSTYSSSGGVFVGDDQDFGEVGDVQAANIPGATTIEKSYNYVYDKLTQEGSSNDPHMHTSACLGVLLLETPNINPAVVGGYKGRAWGICQWLGSRRKQLFARYGRTKRLDHQLDFMWWELNNTERRAKDKWLNSTNMPDAVAGFAAFERAEEWNKKGYIMRNHPNYKKRLSFAYGVYEKYKFRDVNDTETLTT